MAEKEDKTRLERLVAIDERISNNKFPTMRALCQTFNVKPRTIYADIRLLRERFGLDIRFDRFRNGYFNASPGKRIPISDLNEEHYVLAIAACFALSSMFGANIDSLLRAAIINISKRLPYECAAVEDAPIFIPLKGGESNIEPSVLTGVVSGLLQNKVVELESSDGSRFKYVPCSFLEGSDGWLLLGWHCAESLPKKFELKELIGCQVTEEPAPVNRSSILLKYFGSNT